MGSQNGGSKVAFASHVGRSNLRRSKKKVPQPDLGDSLIKLMVEVSGIEKGCLLAPIIVAGQKKMLHSKRMLSGGQASGWLDPPSGWNAVGLEKSTMRYG